MSRFMNVMLALAMLLATSLVLQGCEKRIREADAGGPSTDLSDNAS